MFVLNEKCPVCGETIYDGERAADIGGKSYHLECLEEGFTVEEILTLTGTAVYEFDGPVRPRDEVPFYGSLADPCVRERLGMS